MVKRLEEEKAGGILCKRKEFDSGEANGGGDQEGLAAVAACQLAEEGVEAAKGGCGGGGGRRGVGRGLGQLAGGTRRWEGEMDGGMDAKQRVVVHVGVGDDMREI